MEVEKKRQRGGTRGYIDEQVHPNRVGESLMSHMWGIPPYRDGGGSGEKG